MICFRLRDIPSRISMSGSIYGRKSCLPRCLVGYSSKAKTYQIKTTTCRDDGGTNVDFWVSNLRSTYHGSSGIWCSVTLQAFAAAWKFIEMILSATGRDFCRTCRQAIQDEPSEKHDSSLVYLPNCDLQVPISHCQPALLSSTH